MKKATFLFALIALVGALAGPASAAHVISREEVDALGAEIEEMARSKDALGTYFDEERGEFVVVLPSQGSTFSALDASSAKAPTRSVTSSFDQEFIDAALRDLEYMRSAVPETVYAFGFDPVSGRIELLSDGPGTEFASVMRQYPGLIDYRFGEFTRAGRLNDGEPFTGGGAIETPVNCTAGFTMKWPNGTKRMITAGHCYTHGTQTKMGQAIRNSSFYPYYDLAMLSGKTYRGYVYTGNTSSLKVIHAGNPTIGGTYCTTSNTTGIYCYWKLRSLNKTMCYEPDGCYHGLTGFDDPALGKHVAVGDSGGPLWIFWNNDQGIGVRGVISGYFFDVYSGRYVSWATQYQTIANALGGTATFP